jgi:quercetin dioxygenase-like cupin family protein
MNIVQQAMKTSRLKLPTASSYHKGSIEEKPMEDIMMTKPDLAKSRGAAGFLLGVAAGGMIASLVSAAIAASPAPTEHKGLSVETLGVIPPSSMQAAVGLAGYKLQMRAITIAPGGHIARHSHANRPGLVKVIDGEWVEGRDSGEVVFAADKPVANIEDENTTHWFFNRGGEPATAIVCDIVPGE